jgi:hypothetical protein
VRVVAGVWPPYEFGASNTVRIPVRIADTTRQATLREIEQLIQRRASYSQTPDERLSAVNESKPLNPAFIGTDQGNGAQSFPAQAYQTWIVRPRVPLRLRLDRAFDSAVRSEIEAKFNEPGNFYGRQRRHDSTLRDRKADISYTFEELPTGGRVRIMTANHDALNVVHDFLNFQIQDHHTGDKTD